MRILTEIHGDKDVMEGKMKKKKKASDEIYARVAVRDTIFKVFRPYDVDKLSLRTYDKADLSLCFIRRNTSLKVFVFIEDFVPPPTKPFLFLTRPENTRIGKWALVMGTNE